MGGSDSHTVRGVGGETGSCAGETRTRDFLEDLEMPLVSREKDSPHLVDKRQRGRQRHRLSSKNTRDHYCSLRDYQEI